MHRIIINKWADNKLSIKVSKWTFICLNLIVIVVAFYVLKTNWKVLKAEQQELIRQKILRNKELPIDEMLSSVATRKAVLITLVVTAIILAAIGVIGAYKHNSCLIEIHLIFSITIASILALGYKNYVNYLLYYVLSVSLLTLLSLISSILIYVLKEEPNWAKQRALLINSRYSF